METSTPSAYAPAGDEIEEEACFADWDDLVVAVRDRPADKREFVICPESTLSVTSPVIIEDSNYITIQCGTDESPSKNCVIEGGFSHFHIVGSSSSVQLARLNMAKSTGSSIMALGSSGATLNLRECEWTMNEGASAILIRNDEGLNTAGGSGLDIMPMLVSSGETAAMSVEVTDCVFRSNELTFGAITNVGGTLSVNRTKFVKNAGRSGDIVVTNNGTCTVQASCFDGSSSVAPGVIFVENGSEITDNVNNFGLEISAGSHTGGTCTDVFVEAEGADCLGSDSCAGTCMEFSATMCPMDASMGGSESGMETGTPTADAPAEDIIKAPAHANSDSEASGSPNFVPILVAMLVSACAVFGLAGFIFFRRRKAKGAPSSNNDIGSNSVEGSQRCGGRGCFWKKREGKSPHKEEGFLELGNDDDSEVDLPVGRFTSVMGSGVLMSERDLHSSDR